MKLRARTPNALQTRKLTSDGSLATMPVSAISIDVLMQDTIPDIPMNQISNVESALLPLWKSRKQRKSAERRKLK